jgi:hypothetical protein
MGHWQGFCRLVNKINKELGDKPMNYWNSQDLTHQTNESPKKKERKIK